jgi:predicted 3-demethylubiquinone-9 3-methyltransferase (glyoxalase superfamily)
MEKITPFLWFDTQAEEAAQFYTSVFPDSSIGEIMRYGKEGFEVHHMPEGTAMTVPFTINGQSYTALNGGPIFKFNESISFVVHCKDQAEVDHYWGLLSAVPESEQCGWCKDTFGLSWQIVPDTMFQYLGGSDKEGAGRAMNAMMKMKKLDIAALQAAYEGN